MLRSIAIGCLVGATLYSSAARAAAYNETTDGDLSGNRLAPTLFAVTPGSNTITATSQAGDLEYFRFTVPAGHRLSAVNVVSSTSTSLSFIAIQQGTVFTEPPTGTNTSQLYGYTHFGPGNGTIGTDILDNLGTGFGAAGFVPPLPAGNYVFWSQETGASVTYTLDFVVTAVPPGVPIPRSGIALLALGLALLGVTRLRGLGSKVG